MPKATDRTLDTMAELIEAYDAAHALAQQYAAHIANLELLRPRPFPLKAELDAANRRFGVALAAARKLVKQPNGKAAR